MWKLKWSFNKNIRLSYVSLCTSIYEEVEYLFIKQIIEHDILLQVWYNLWTFSILSRP